MVNNKKEAKVGRNQEESDLTKQSNLLNFVNAMDLSESTLSLDNLFNIEADDEEETTSNKTPLTEPKMIKVKLSKTNKATTKNPNVVKKVTIS
ncbi:hypothetical domain protein [Mycoplasmoides gallisepticum]|uniref:Hypothetical domain protein n=3 Tax=Mycoplasmoides gallisepticum TaxID=2096 RepID=A0A3B0PZ91_MYCGL|nr:hypothetical domain protein [Mycoplasmoides gallisepticum]